MGGSSSKDESSGTEPDTEDERQEGEEKNDEDKKENRAPTSQSQRQESAKSRQDSAKSRQDSAKSRQNSAKPSSGRKRAPGSRNFSGSRSPSPKTWDKGSDSENSENESDRDDRSERTGPVRGAGAHGSARSRRSERDGRETPDSQRSHISIVDVEDAQAADPSGDEEIIEYFEESSDEEGPTSPLQEETSSLQEDEETIYENNVYEDTAPVVAYSESQEKPEMVDGVAQTDLRHWREQSSAKPAPAPECNHQCKCDQKPSKKIIIYNQPPTFTPKKNRAPRRSPTLDDSDLEDLEEIYEKQEKEPSPPPRRRTRPRRQSPDNYSQSPQRRSKPGEKPPEPESEEEDDYIRPEPGAEGKKQNPNSRAVRPERRTDYNRGRDYMKGFRKAKLEHRATSGEPKPESADSNKRRNSEGDKPKREWKRKKKEQAPQVKKRSELDRQWKAWGAHPRTLSRDPERDLPGRYLA